MGLQPEPLTHSLTSEENVISAPEGGGLAGEILDYLVKRNPLACKAVILTVNVLGG